MPAPAPFAFPRIVVADDDLVLATWANVLICAWGRERRTERSPTLAEHIAGLAPTTPLGVFSVVERGRPLLDDKERSEQARVFDAMAISFRALVFEGDGFPLAAMHAVMTGINLAVKDPHPARVFGSITDAANWAVTIDPTAGPAGQLEMAVRSVRATRSVSPPEDEEA
jgi:hypothetical protein